MRDLDWRLTNVNKVLTRVSSIPKPKEPKKKKPSNIKMENVKINGEDAENLEDFIKFENDNVGNKEEQGNEKTE